MITSIINVKAAGSNRDVCIYNVKHTQKRYVDHSCISRMYLRVSARKNTLFCVCVSYRVCAKNNRFTMRISITIARSDLTLERPFAICYY